MPAGFLVLFLLVAGYYRLTLPPLEQLERIAPSLASRMYDKDSVLIREFYSQRRVWIPVAQVPERQIRAVLAIEDQDFFRHGGVDLSAFPSALLPAMTGGRVRGASTLTQQLTKLLFLGPERSLARKVKEILMAVEIERTYTKKEILEFYLNQVYLGAGAYGFQAAAERYFSRPLVSLNLSQQALMAGLLQRPESLRPDRHPAQALDRRNTVLRAMAATGAISRPEMEDALKRPLDVRMRAFSQASGGDAAYFVETVRKNLETRWGKGFLDSAGAKVYTTLDRRAQELVDSCLAENLALIQDRMNHRTLLELGMPGRLKKSEYQILRDFDRQYARFDSLFLRKDTLSGKRRFPESARYHKAQAAVVVLENGTGAVRALAGGLDWRESNYNRAIQAVRSPGSAFKPIVYAAAIDMGGSPAFRVVDAPFSMPDPQDTSKQWAPQNLENDFEGTMTWRRALYRSRNIPAIKVAMETGLDTVVAYARRFGLSRPMLAVPAVGLGAGDATPMEMTAAFSVFPNSGEWLEPRFLESMSDRNGSSLGLGQPMRRRVMGEGAAWILAGMLRDVNIRGTAAEIWASGFYQPSGGKTGTTNDYCDAWYIGFTRGYTVGVWIGTDDHASLGSEHTGTAAAMPLWLDIMRGLHKGMKVRNFEQDFPRPPGIADVAICMVSGNVAQGFCDSVVHDFRVAGMGQLPACRSDLHSGEGMGFGPGSTADLKKFRPRSFLENMWKKLKSPF